ncbi:TIGR03936 family radical SAM-associated protein, partial [Clostridia bacterium OttesenSCG-928-F22]|nr:TIGR03936 family radical SAM-associated protein [Clostridia bacterium OttesenSCG-928-F22]
MRMIAKFTKEEPVRYISHLDIQRLFGRAFRRTDIPITYSKGFNPHPVLSFAMALPLGQTSSGEYMDIGLDAAVSTEEFIEKCNASLPQGIRILEARMVGDKFPSLMSKVLLADYTIKVPLPEGEIERAV